MSRIGVLGGMGPLATVDFMAKLVALTPAKCDQEHLPVVVASLPQVPDRSAAILGQGADPLPRLLQGVRLLNEAGAGVLAIPCNSSHHWYEAMCRHSDAPVLHIARASVSALPPGRSTAILATRGCLSSGFYQRELALRAHHWTVPDPDTTQHRVDEVIREVKAGRPLQAGQALGKVLSELRRMGVAAAILGCTELPIAAQHTETGGLLLVDSTLELARAAVKFALSARWNQMTWA